MQKRRSWVAVVDDEADLAQLFSEALNVHGIKTIAFNDPIFAVDYLYHRHDKFSLIITDWRMPGMTGLELAKLVRQMDDQIKVMLMSAFDLEEGKLEEIKINEFLRKPMHISQLVEAVRKQMLEIDVVASGLV